MRKKLLVLLLVLIVPLQAMVAAKSATVVAQGTVCNVTFYAPDIVRVVKYPQGAKGPSENSLVVTMAPLENMKVNITKQSGTTLLKSKKLTVAIDNATGIVSFFDGSQVLLKEKGTTFEERNSGPDKGAYRVTQVYELDGDEPIYGLGTLQDGKLNRRGTQKFMEQSNLEDFQYVVQSLKGWGIYWDNYSRADFKDDASGMSFSAEVGDASDYYFMYGGSADGVNALMRQLSGKVDMFPLWTYGFWQCRERYKTENELLEVVDWHRKNNVPLDGIIQDWQYWGSNYTWNAMDFIGEGFRHGQMMVDSVHRMNAHLMISIWANFGPYTKGYRQLDEKGLLFDFETWPQSGISHIWPPRMDYPSGVRVYDAYSKEARDIYWQNLKTLYDYGVDAWWMDSTDPDYFNSKDSDYDRMTGLGTWRRVRNAFPLCTVSGVYDNQRKESDDKRVFIMTRSAFAGQQRYGSGLWSGDVASTWDMLRKQIPAGLNYTMTGCPNFNTDIGGFFCGAYNRGRISAPQNPQYQELYVRWMQYGLFCPVFRSHGADAPREIYQFGKKGEPVFDAIESAIRLRYRLIPYLYSTAWQVTSSDESYLRALVYDFPNDRKVWNMTDEFMFGRNILAAPIVEPQYTAEEIIKDHKAVERCKAETDFNAGKTAEKYLPEGASWYDFWTEQKHKGGQSVRLETALDRVPMFVRAGSILPLAPVMQYAGERQWDNLEIIVYPGADATFTLYEDEGDNYNYEKGQYSTITFRWNDKAGKLSVGKRAGAFKGMLNKRTFNVRVVGKEQTKTVSYDGTKAVSVRF